MNLYEPTREQALAEIANMVRNERQKTGREVREMLETLRDEGYIDVTDDEFEALVKQSQ